MIDAGENQFLGSEVNHANNDKQFAWAVYRCHGLFTYDFNEEHNTDINPIAKNDVHFQKWLAFILIIQMYKRKG